MARAPYNEAAYRAMAAHLKAHPAVCWRCGGVATSPDHVPALASHAHTPGGRCCELRPACARCQRAQGGRLSWRRRDRGATSRRW